MIVVTTNDIPNHKVVKIIGMVHGLVVRTPTIRQGVLGGLKNMIGGGNQSYTAMCLQAREEAYNKMIDDAKSQGANAIIAMRYDSDSIGGATTTNEVFCYGTAAVVSD